MVIAKGSERVAEVAARFTLDALPGKQMSIDADVRAGLIDFETARKRRQEMQTESRFYGALDGAMKFVKGDAIAGIIIAAINIIGGLSIGILSEGLELQGAVSKYTLLTIGDGLVSQIPALLSALAAGIVVTRVARGDGATVSQELFAQLGQIRAAKYIIAGFCMAIMFVPGMPIVPFSCLAVVLIVSALLMKERKDDGNSAEVRFEPRRVPLIQIVIARERSSSLGSLSDLRTAFNKSRNEIYEKSGILLLPPDFSVSDSLKDSFQITIRGVVAFKEQFLEENDAALKQILAAYSFVILNRKTELIDDILSRRLLDFLDKEHPELVSAVVPGSITITQFTEILKALCREGISIRQTEMILQGIAESNFKAEGTRLLLEDVRVAMGRVIVDRYIAPNSKLQCIVIDAALDATLVQAERGEKALPASAIASLAEELKGLCLDGYVLLASKGARALLKDCLRLRRVIMPVLAHEEVPEDIVLEIGSIVGGGSDEEAEELISSLAA